MTGGATVVYVASTRLRAFDWVRANFHPEREPPSEKNLMVITPAYLDRQRSGRGLITATRTPEDDLQFMDWGKGGILVDH